MRVKNTIPARLLTTDPDKPKIWLIKIQLPRAQWAEMKFSQREMAIGEFNRIKGQAVFGGQWLEGVTLEEIPQ